LRDSLATACSIADQEDYRASYDQEERDTQKATEDASAIKSAFEVFVVHEENVLSWQSMSNGHFPSFPSS